MKTLLKINYLLTFSLAVGLILASCNGKEAYYQFDDVAKATWSKTDTLNYVVDTASIVPGVAYNIDVETVNNAKFPYQNLWLFVRSNVAGAKDFQQDTLQIKLADPFGKWLGSGFGSYYQVSSPFKMKVVFSQKRNYKFQIIQGMRDEPLVGIEKVGLKISRSE